MQLQKARRALLFMPGDDRRKIEKGAALEVDAVIMDLEDGVALNNKAAARQTTAVALREVNFGHTERLVRINPIIEGGLWRDDLNSILGSHPDGSHFDGLVIPKVENAHQIKRAAEQLAHAEGKYGWIEGGIRLWAIIETARGIINLKEIVESDPRLTALIFGAEDLAGDIGAIRTREGWEVHYARSAVVLYAKAYGLAAIDTPFVDLSPDETHLITETEQALSMGYTGKLAIHPKQVAPIQKVFTPTEAQIQRAKALIDVHQSQQASGRGVFEFEGRMVDMPMIRAAESILARASAAGIALE